MKKTIVLIPLGGVGQTKTASSGFPGGDCRAVTGPIIAALGGQVTSDEAVEDTEQVKAVAYEGGVG